jgi:hypothetical protein
MTSTWIQKKIRNPAMCNLRDRTTLHNVISSFNKSVESAQDMSKAGALEADLAILVALFPPLESLSLIITLETYNGVQKRLEPHELDPVDVTFFRHAADELNKLDLALEVFRKEVINKAKKLLVRERWTVGLPL